MDYETREQIKGLSEFLIRYQPVQKFQNESLEAKDADLQWDAPKFWAQVLHLSSVVKYSLTLEQFNDFKRRYEIENNISINETVLFSSHWLRCVLNNVKIAGSICCDCLTFEKINGFKEELKFLLGFQLKRKESGDVNKLPLSREVIKAAAKIYEENTKTTLKEEGIFFNRWFSESEGKTSLSDISIYFKPYLDCWDDYLFVSKLKEKIADDRGFLIDSKLFKSIHRKHKKNNPLTPNIKELVAGNKNEKGKSVYTIDFYKFGHNYWHQLSDKACGYYWDILIKEDKYADDTERLKEWVFKASHFSYELDSLEFVTSHSKERLLDAALNILLSEKDIDGIKEEYQKVLLDHTHNHFPVVGLLEKSEPHAYLPLKNKDLFELYEALHSWEDNSQITMLYDQRSRNELFLLLKLILLNDSETQKADSSNEDAFEVLHYKRVMELLRASITKPFILWNAVQLIINQRPAILPYLLIESDLADLVIKILDNIKFEDEQKPILALSLWKKSVSLLLNANTVRPIVDKERIAQHIFRIYLSLNKTKFNIPYNRSNRNAEITTRQQLEERENSILSIIEEQKIGTIQWPQTYTMYLIPEIFEELSKCFISYPAQTKYRNGTLQFPMLQWDGMIWLLRIATLWKYKNQVEKFPVTVKELTEEFFSIYSRVIETTEIKTYDYFEEKDEIATPLWSEKIERLNYLDWVYPIYNYHGQSQLDSFLSPHLSIEPEKDVYHKKNNFTADKLRTHIGVLLQVLRKLVAVESALTFDRQAIGNIRSKIETQIISYLRKYLVNKPEEGRIDILAFQKERNDYQSEHESLLPQIAKSINGFSNKKEVIDCFVEAGDIAKVLTLLEYITSEGVKTLLFNEIKQLDITKFLEEYHWIPEIQNVVVGISKYPQFQGHIVKAIQYWEKEVMSRRKDNKEYKEILFRTKLLLAYFRDDEKELDSIAEPIIKYYQPSGHELVFADYKKFYKGLIAIKSNPSKAYEIFKELFSRKPTYLSFGINRTVAKMNWLEQDDIKKDKEDYREAFHEWNDFVNGVDSDTLPLLEPDYSRIQISLLNKLGEHDKAVELYKGLELHIKMLPYILEEQVDSYIALGKSYEASLLVETAKTYHLLTPGEHIPFIDELLSKASGIDNVDQLKIYYSQIFSSSPKKFIRILPENLNGKVDLYPFIVKEFIHAADKMLGKIKSIEEIKNEDKYNDLVEVLLDARINPWGWHVAAQSRGAFPETGTSGKQPGERDLPIMDINKKIILLCEAFIYRGSGTAKEHLQKIFNYHHQREAMAMLIYNTGYTRKSFEVDWEDYCKEIIPNTAYPDSYQFCGPVKDLSSQFDCSNAAIKICASKHGTDTIIYHLFVNINYGV